MPRLCHRHRQASLAVGGSSAIKPHEGRVTDGLSDVFVYFSHDGWGLTVDFRIKLRSRQQKSDLAADVN